MKTWNETNQRTNDRSIGKMGRGKGEWRAGLSKEWMKEQVHILTQVAIVLLVITFVIKTFNICRGANIKHGKWKRWHGRWNGTGAHFELKIEQMIERKRTKNDNSNTHTHTAHSQPAKYGRKLKTQTWQDYLSLYNVTAYYIRYSW